jgi:Zn-dependent peptidase ImmA (M78 family)
MSVRLSRKKRLQKPKAKVLPKYIRFGFHQILVEQVTEEFMREEADCEDDEETPEGLWATDVDTVFILKNLSRHKKRYYLMHECIHACLDLMDSIDL